MIRAYAYLRVSGQGQVKGHGFKRQQDTIVDFAKANGYVIERVFKDKAVSGTKAETERPAFSEMVEAMLANSVRTVIVESLDRLGRQYSVTEHLIIYLASKGITLINAGTGQDVTKDFEDDPMKTALIQMQGVFSQLEKNLLVRKLRKSREAKRIKEGKCEGRKRYGEVDSEEKAVKQRIFYLRRKPRGLNKKRKTYQEIADILNQEGVKTRMGKPWTATQIWRVVNHKHK